MFRGKPFILLIFLASCARVPDSEVAQRYEPVSVETSMETAVAGAFVEIGGWPSEKWWEMFEDKQLSALIELALENSPTLQRARARVEETQQAAKKTRSALMPTLTGNYGENWEYFSKRGFVRSFYPTPPILTAPPTINQIDLSLNFNYELDFFGKNQNLFREALGAARAAQADASEAALLISTLVAQTYIDLQMKLVQKEALETKLDTRRALLDLTMERAEGGLDPAAAVLEDRQTLYRVDQALQNLEKEITLDQHMLNRLVGKGPDEKLLTQPLKALFDRKVCLPKELSLDLIARRPDLTAQLWRLESAAKAVGAAKADFYPRINLMAFGGVESLAWNNLLSWGSKQGALSPALYLPIFMGGRLRANLKEKIAIFNEQTYSYNELILRAAQEVADAVETLKTAFTVSSLQEEALQSAQDQCDLQRSCYEAGISDFLSVLLKEENALNELDAFYGSQRDYLLAVVKVIKALGGGYQSEETPQVRKQL